MAKSKPLPRFNMTRAKTDVLFAEGFWGKVGSSALWLAKGSVNTGLALLESTPEMVARMKERQGK